MAARRYGLNRREHFVVLHGIADRADRARQVAAVVKHGEADHAIEAPRRGDGGDVLGLERVVLDVAHPEARRHLLRRLDLLGVEVGRDDPSVRVERADRGLVERGAAPDGEQTLAAFERERLVQERGLAAIAVGVDPPSDVQVVPPLPVAARAVPSARFREDVYLRPLLRREGEGRDVLDDLLAEGVFGELTGSIMAFPSGRGRASRAFHEKAVAPHQASNASDEQVVSGILCVHLG